MEVFVACIEICISRNVFNDFVDGLYFAISGKYSPIYSIL